MNIYILIIPLKICIKTIKITLATLLQPKISNFVMILRGNFFNFLGLHWDFLIFFGEAVFCRYEVAALIH